MRAFTCGRCGQLIFFENTRCLHCGSALAFAWEDREVRTGDVGADDPRWLRCPNAAVATCNWLAPAPGALCFSCSLTRTRPSDAEIGALAAFAEAEAAKRRLLFELGDLGLPIPSWRDEDGGFAFDLLSSEAEPVTTGHADGVVTLDLAETDDAHREQMRAQMGEPYRTTLGHFRHEIGHAYFPLLTTQPSALERARSAFGDERADYQEALDRHYANGAPADWNRRHVSAYATMHPAEDWAETFAHVLHIRDALQTAGAYGVTVAGPAFVLRSDPDEEVTGTGMRAVVGDWLPLTYALNAINRSMGHDDLYPFVLPKAAVDKLVLVDELMADAGYLARSQ